MQTGGSIVDPCGVECIGREGLVGRGGVSGEVAQCLMTQDGHF